jgi:hypothetical protein
MMAEAWKISLGFCPGNFAQRTTLETPIPAFEPKKRRENAIRRRRVSNAISV